MKPLNLIINKIVGTGAKAILIKIYLSLILLGIILILLDSFSGSLSTCGPFFDLSVCTPWGLYFLVLINFPGFNLGIIVRLLFYKYTHSETLSVIPAIIIGLLTNYLIITVASWIIDKIINFAKVKRG